jgi:repressor LexA
MANTPKPYLTERQRAVHTYISTYFRRFRKAPTRLQIQVAFGFASPNAAQDYVNVLVKKGVLIREEGKHRGLVPQAAPRNTADDPRFALHY